MASVAYIGASKLSDLLNSADPHKSMYVRVLSETQLAVGADPLQPTSVVDFSREKIIPYADVDAVSAPLEVPNVKTSKLQRRSGDYWLEIRGKRVECVSLKELLAEGLRALEKAKPGMLDMLSLIKVRSRRIVARDASQLFDKPHLAKDYAEKLVNGWYYGTNNSARETSVWLERATELAALSWGGDFKTSLDSIDGLP